MKILGKTQFGFIVEVKKTEMAALLGQRNFHEQALPQFNRDFDIDDSWHQMMRLLEKPGDLARLSESLRSIATITDMQQDHIRRLAEATAPEPEVEG